MGRATRWIKGLFGVKSTQKDPQFFTDSNSGRHSIDAGVLCNNPATIPPNITPSEAAWLKSYYSESGEQSKHAIAVATATAAAADAAVAAAQAAVAVVRLTSRGRGTVLAAGRGSGGEEKRAAVTIQTTFRGFLARKALRALRGLVKIQALVRGYLVRKQAKATLHGIQALIRAQNTARSKRVLLLQPTHIRTRTRTHIHTANHPEFFRARRSLEIFDGSKSEQEAALHSRRLSASFESRTISPIIEDIAKIVEVDPGRPDTYETDPFYTPRLSIPRFHTDQLGHMGRECGSSSAQSTPRFTYPGPGTPSRSVCGDKESKNYSYFLRHFRNYQNAHPNYMSKTESFRAKVRSQSAPKHRPESQAQEAINFKNVVMGKLEKSYEFAKDPNRYNLCNKN